MIDDGAQLHGTSLNLLEQFRDGDDLAAEALFSRYFDRLTALARSRLSARLASRTDPEDIVVNLVAGSNLDQIIRTRIISVDEALHWAMQICHALEHAHARGIIHCDLKPANLLLDEDGRIRVTDFGLARSLTEHTPWTAEVEGTAPFMAPEQASRCWGEIDVQADVYGIGAVLYALLTGRPPWVGRRLPDILADVISAAPVVPPVNFRPDLPKPLSDLCRKCLSKAQEDRYPTVQAVRMALANAAGEC